MVAPALALGGDAARPDSGLKSHLVMVLSRQANRHGACTGTVIAPDIILTAAHCVAGNKTLAIAYPEGESHILQRVADKAINPGYSGKSRVSLDLALVRLESALPARFAPLSMDFGTNEHGIGQNRQVAGYGLTVDRGEATGGTLRSARVSILPKIYPRFMRIGQETGTTLSDFAICTGDSGGPVLDGALVVGVVYGREKFGTARDCGVTAQAVRLAPQRDWIEGVLARWNGRGVSTPRRPLGLTAQ
jgi:secreted trypsin-like serine protease